ncbi:MBL fold metallo-hydrolase [Hydrogenophaga palleronii]|uniref:MBL fold metallo-hydrolase n=1 Tax=Hydrogenophaga palleronii TaxID=65655 RepID=UPI000A828DA6|nr:MBL fold metallo-hydrolase [Hydrogenophaga palleronii]
MTLHPQPLQLFDTHGMPVHGLRLGCVDIHLGDKCGKFPDGNQVLVRGSATAAFDTPMMSNRIPDVLASADMVILGHVHEDHTAGLHLLPETPVYAPEGDINALRSLEGLARHYGYADGIAHTMAARAQTDFHYMPRPDAQSYADQTTWDLGGVQVRAIHMPGHTAGHSVLMIEPLDIAFIGDIDLSSFGPYYGDACSNLGDFRRSLAAIESLPAQAWITSHHKGVVTDRASFLALLSQFRGAIDRRHEAILAAIRQRPSTLQELVSARFVYPVHFNDVFVPSVESRVISQHLEEMLAAQLVHQTDHVFHAS